MVLEMCLRRQVVAAADCDSLARNACDGDVLPVIELMNMHSLGMAIEEDHITNTGMAEAWEPAATGPVPRHGAVSWSVIAVGV